MDQVEELRKNCWSRPCATGRWTSTVVLAAKPHQELVMYIRDFIWRMCMLYRGLNAVTCPHELPIPRCDEALDSFGCGAGLLFWLSLDAKSGYHQIRVRGCDQEKLAFFLPDDTKETFIVIPFRPMNAPACYTMLMTIMWQEWQACLP